MKGQRRGIGAAGEPVVVRVVGLKKSGKTTVATAIVRELAARGMRVGAVKSSSHGSLRLDPADTDTSALADAGAGVTVAVLPGQVVRFERTVAGRLEDVLGLFGPDIEVLVCEGSFPPGGAARTIVCVASPEDLGRTLEVRGLLDSPIVAVSGVGASGVSAGAAAAWRGRTVPMVDARSPEGARTLAELVLAEAPG